MPNYKCVGGELDGRWHEVPVGMNKGDHVVIMRSPRATLADLESSPGVYLDKPVVVDRYLYTLRVIAARDKVTGEPYVVTRYLAPHDWTDERAIVHQFTK